MQKVQWQLAAGSGTARRSAESIGCRCCCRESRRRRIRRRRAGGGGCGCGGGAGGWEVGGGLATGRVSIGRTGWYFRRRVCRDNDAGDGRHGRFRGTGRRTAMATAPAASAAAGHQRHRFHPLTWLHASRVVPRDGIGSRAVRCCNVVPCTLQLRQEYLYVVLAVRAGIGQCLVQRAPLGSATRCLAAPAARPWRRPRVRCLRQRRGARSASGRRRRPVKTGHLQASAVLRGGLRGWRIAACSRER